MCSRIFWTRHKGVIHLLRIYRAAHLLHPVLNSGWISGAPEHILVERGQVLCLGAAGRACTLWWRRRWRYHRLSGYIALQLHYHHGIGRDAERELAWRLQTQEPACLELFDCQANAGLSAPVPNRDTKPAFPRTLPVRYHGT